MSCTNATPELLGGILDGIIDSSEMYDLIGTSRTIEPMLGNGFLDTVDDEETVHAFCMWDNMLHVLPFPVAKEGWFRTEEKSVRWDYMDGSMQILVKHSSCFKAPLSKHTCEKCQMRAIWHAKCDSPVDTFFVYAFDDTAPEKLARISRKTIKLANDDEAESYRNAAPAIKRKYQNEVDAFAELTDPSRSVASKPTPPGRTQKKQRVTPPPKKAKTDWSKFSALPDIPPLSAVMMTPPNTEDRLKQLVTKTTPNTSLAYSSIPSPTTHRSSSLSLPLLTNLETIVLKPGKPSNVINQFLMKEFVEMILPRVVPTENIISSHAHMEFILNSYLVLWLKHASDYEIGYIPEDDTTDAVMTKDMLQLDFLNTSRVVSRTALKESCLVVLKEPNGNIMPIARLSN